MLLINLFMLSDGFPITNFCFGFLFFGDFLRVDGVMNEIKLKLRLEVDQVDAGVDVGVEVDQVDLVDVGEVDVVVGIYMDQVDGGVNDYVDVVVAFEVDQVDGVGGKRV